MTPLGFYLFWSPVAVAALSLVARLASKNRIPELQDERMAGAFYLNYALANLFFVWAWEFSHSWRGGVLTASTLLVAGCTLGQALASVSALKQAPGNRFALYWLALGVCLNLPIMGITMWRKLSGLPLT